MLGKSWNPLPWVSACRDSACVPGAAAYATMDKGGSPLLQLAIGWMLEHGAVVNTLNTAIKA